MIELEEWQAWIDQGLFPAPAHDARDLIERLKDLARRGTQTPVSLTTEEIQHLSLALSILLSKKK